MNFQSFHHWPKMWLSSKQAVKLKSCKMKEGWMKNDEEWMKNDEGWMINDVGWWFQANEGFCRRTNEWTNKVTDICDCGVAFATENYQKFNFCNFWGVEYQKI